MLTGANIAMLLALLMVVESLLAGPIWITTCIKNAGIEAKNAITAMNT